MAKLLQYYLQSLSINGKEIPREDVVESSYMEGLNFKGPLLLLKIRDVSGSVIDNAKVKKASQVVASLGDATGSASLFQETFFVAEAPRQNDTVHITSIALDTQKLLMPTSQPMFFVDKQPSEIIRQLAPTLTVNAETLQKVGTWHLIMAQKPAVLMKQIATDTGAAAWVARHTLNYRTNDSLANQSPAFTYEYNNPSAKYTISKVSNINADHAYITKKQFRYMGYHEQDGLKVAGDASLPIKMVSDQDLGVLQNKHIMIIPKLDVEVAGNPALQAGQVISVVMHRYDSVNRLNESVPKNMVIAHVTHYEDRFVYLTRMVLGIPYDPEDPENLEGGGSDFSRFSSFF